MNFRSRPGEEISRGDAHLRGNEVDMKWNCPARLKRTDGDTQFCHGRRAQKQGRGTLRLRRTTRWLELRPKDLKEDGTSTQEILSE